MYGLDPYVVEKQSVKDSYMRKGINIELIKCAAEEIPFPDNFFDIVVSTLVLCSVNDPNKCIQEVLRVLHPTGKFISQEHIHAEPETSLAIQQEVFDPLQQVIANGCHLTRETDSLLNSFLHETSSVFFRKRLDYRILTFDSHWPISRQMFSVYEK